MTKLIISCFLCLSLMLTAVALPANAVPAMAADDYILTYKKQNRWVAQEDAKGLRALLKDAKKAKKTTFYVQLPTEKRSIAIDRLVVLRDILEKQLKQPVTIEEVSASAENNQIIVSFKK